MKRVIYLLLVGLGLNNCFSSMAAADPFLYVDVLGLTTNALVSDPMNLSIGHTGLQLMPIYLRVQFPTTNFTAWGIQIYTNNSDGTWTASNGIYGGLRDTTNPALTPIQLYWQVYGDMQSDTVSAQGLGFDVMSHWGRVFDRNDYDVSGNWLENSNLLARTIMNYQGLGNYPSSSRLWTRSPVYVYLGMDVVGAPLQEFQSTLRMDFYNLGISPSKGGYATPNPFTPVTGQRTNFNFFLQDSGSNFIIRIYTLRGRQVRAITDSREWDGRNESGQLVEGGLYIYQIEAENQRISGTVVVIK